MGAAIRLPRRALFAGALLLWIRCLSAAETPCCGPITPAGERLGHFLDGTSVDQLWPSGWHVNWQTGEPDRPEPGGRNAHTHCSAFVAAMTVRLGIYILRPPEHRQQLLANAQMHWLGEEGAASGWRPVDGEQAAQTLANQGILVVASYENPDPHRPGHIAILRPSLKSAAELASDGPQITQAGGHNFISTTLQNGFRARRPSVVYYAHELRSGG